MGLRWVGPALLVLGAALVVAAVATGGAHLALVVIVPVLYGGSAPLWLGGIVALLLGFLALGWTFGEELPEAEADRDAPRGSGPGPTGLGSGGSGGLVLLGPVPIFFGAWKHPARRWVVLAVAVGTVLLVVAIAVALVVA